MSSRPISATVPAQPLPAMLTWMSVPRLPPVTKSRLPKIARPFVFFIGHYRMCRVFALTGQPIYVVVHEKLECKGSR